MIVILVLLIAVCGVVSIGLYWSEYRNGCEPFSAASASALPREEVREWALQVLARDLGYASYRLESQGKKKVIFMRRWRPFSVWALTVLLFPLGLLIFFLAARVSRISVLMSRAADGGTEIVVCGDARPRVIEGVRHRMTNDFLPIAG